MKKKSKSVVKQQVMPKKNKNVAVWDLVLADIKERDQDGIKKYGTRLQTFNGRDALQDAYQEVLDLVVYFRQSIEERKEMIALLKEASNLYTMTPIEVDDLASKSQTLLDQLGEY